MILFHNEDVQLSFDNEPEVSLWLEDSVVLESRTIGALSVIFCSDDYLLKINQEHLKHDFYTDIITFDYSEGSIISGDLFISVDRVKDNSNSLNTEFTNELHRVIIHGVLHLCGYHDKIEQDKNQMRSKEDHYLSLRAFI